MLWGFFGVFYNWFPLGAYRFGCDKMNELKQINELAKKTELSPDEKNDILKRYLPIQTIQDAYARIEQGKRFTYVDYQESFNKQFDNVVNHFCWDSSLEISKKAAHEFFRYGTPIHESVKKQLIESLANRKSRTEYAASLIRTDLEKFCQKLESDIRDVLKGMGFIFQAGAKQKGKDEWDGFESVLKDWEYLESFSNDPAYMIDSRLRILNAIWVYSKNAENPEKQEMSQ